VPRLVAAANSGNAAEVERLLAVGGTDEATLNRALVAAVKTSVAAAVATGNRGNVASTAALIASGAEVNKVAPSDGNTLFIPVVQSGHRAVAMKLIAAGVHVHKKKTGKRWTRRALGLEPIRSAVKELWSTADSSTPYVHTSHLASLASPPHLFIIPPRLASHLRAQHCARLLRVLEML
jgi:hypothetical protein